MFPTYRLPLLDVEVGLHIIAVVGLTLLVLLNSLLRGKKDKDAPPTVALSFPVIGNYIEFAKGPMDLMYKCQEKYGNIFTVPMLHKRLTFVLGPEVSAPFFASDDTKMSQPEVYGFMTPVFGKGVVYDAEPDKRMKQYQGMAHGLGQRAFKAYVPKIEKETVDFFKKHWTSNQRTTAEVNILDALSELTILTASRCLHGDDAREELFEDIARVYHDLDKGVTPLSFFFPYAPTAAHKLRDNARKEMVSIFSKVIKKRREKGASADSTDILQVFIDIKYKDGTSPTDDEVVGLLIALLFAGQHTSSITSTWTTMFLLHHPECLKKVMDEQREIFGDDLKGNGSITFEDVSRMQYLENCIKESLRMHPPLIMLMRMAMQDIKTVSNGKEFVIPKGDIVIASPAVSARMPQVFTNPNKFEPERFAAPRDEHKTPYAYLGFGGGMHACKGEKFGLLQVKTIVSILLRNFKLEALDKQFPEPDYAAMVVGPKNNLNVRYTKLPGSTF